MARTILGFAIAPWVPLLPYALLSTNAMKVPGLLVFGAIGHAIALIVGVPLHLAFRRLGVRRWRAYAIGGGALGALPFVVLLPGVAPQERLGAIAAFVGYGASAALAFWLVALYPWRAR